MPFLRPLGKSPPKPIWMPVINGPGGSCPLAILGPDESQPNRFCLLWLGSGLTWVYVFSDMSCSHAGSAQLAQAACFQEWLKHVQTPSLGFGLTDQIEKMVTFQPKVPEGGDFRGPKRFVKRTQKGNILECIYHTSR